MIKLGYAVGGPKDGPTLKEKITILQSVQTHAIELGSTNAERLNEKLDKEDIERVKLFDYVSIHTPVVSSVDPDSGKKMWLRYPSSEADPILDEILEIAQKTNAQTVLFHPDLVDDFEWLNKKMGSLLAFENMDVEKKFGKSVSDLEKVFHQSPQARWVCDVNHIYTIDRSMKLAVDLHEAFGDRLAHYHLSSYGGFHDCFYITGEDEIMQGLKDMNKPIVHEGWALRDGQDSLEKENEYVLNYFKNK